MALILFAGSSALTCVVSLKAEVELRSRKLDGTFTTAGALSMLQPFRLELGADAWQDKTREVKLQLRNPGG